MNALAIAFVLLLGGGELAEAKRVEALITAGETDKAQAALADAEFSPIVVATLQGRLALAQGKPARAETRFRQALKLAPDHAPLRILVAHATLAQGKHRAVLEVLDGLDADLGIALLRAAAHEGLGDEAAAYRTLVGAKTAVVARRQLVVLCAEHGRFEAARQWAKTLTRAQLGRDLALAILQRIRNDPGAEVFGQWLAAGFPRDREIQAQLGWIYGAQGHHRAAARSFAKAGRRYAFEAAEHHRVAGEFRSALRMNAHVEHVGKRGRQRFDILFEQGAMAKAIAASRGVTLSPRRRYNLAYAHYALQEYADASKLARGLLATEEAARARSLLRAMGR